MHGYPKFCFRIPRARGKSCFLRSFKPRKNIPVLVGTTYKKPGCPEMGRKYVQQQK